MHETVEKLLQIEKLVKSKKEELKLNVQPTIIAVTKTFKIDKILPLIDFGHKHFGENKVQEALEKWTEIKSKKKEIKLHLVGKLQTNKVKYAIKIFDFIHSVDNKKLAKKIADEEVKQNKKVKLFIQVNIGDESQKIGIKKNELKDLFLYCQSLSLDIVGLMCLPPIKIDPNPFFQELRELNNDLQLKELSMGMSSDYVEAIKNSSTFLRIGSSIFGKRS
tara:strand:+ start:388 stop:1047 length:660 start_codon:yes stop_codon:yes gene_type:complete